MMDCPWLSNLVVTLETWSNRFSEACFRRSAWLERPSMALSDWRVMLSLVRRTASMPVISEFVERVGLPPKRVGERADVIVHGDGKRARLLVDGAVDGDRGAQHRVVEQRQPLGEGGIERARALHQLHVEGLGAVGQGGVERHRVVVEHRLQLLGAAGEG